MPTELTSNLCLLSVSKWA